MYGQLAERDRQVSWARPVCGRDSNERARHVDLVDRDGFGHVHTRRTVQLVCSAAVSQAGENLFNSHPDLFVLPLNFLSQHSARQPDQASDNCQKCIEQTNVFCILLLDSLRPLN